MQEKAEWLQQGFGFGHQLSHFASAGFWSNTDAVPCTVSSVSTESSTTKFLPSKILMRFGILPLPADE